ncbi:hypothetical protein D3C72_2486260 [compost metagenome]
MQPPALESLDLGQTGNEGLSIAAAGDHDVACAEGLRCGLDQVAAVLAADGLDCLAEARS